MAKYGVALVAALILLVVNASIWQKERVLANGKTVYLALAPVDPRSLMQGDYMRLRFALEEHIRAHLPTPPPDSQDGYVVVKLNAQQLAEFERLSPTLPSLPDTQQLALQYRIRQGQIKFATNAFFFEEGQADTYAQAKYGEFKVADNGELLLSDLRGENLTVLSKTRL
ncbi:GDYXXLXY domain-containing protein [Agitococcus lubricus]|uniref:Putative membrane-anchored protein n=1 Tax=Agitococcus lubricus TaxID=1077255 RepID=A0A2T5J1N3_9GAMM|nr:GDYXXLXY domain-containing protein [Agitococcus lubricus]PTQ90346.1 putative membrane-anchored protein [Agitococcus lubricus]